MFLNFKFSLFRLVHEIFLTVDDCNMDECLESSYRPTTSHQESQEAGHLPRGMWTGAQAYSLIIAA